MMSYLSTFWVKKMRAPWAISKWIKRTYAYLPLNLLMLRYISKTPEVMWTHWTKATNKLWQIAFTLISLLLRIKLLIQGLSLILMFENLTLIGKKKRKLKLSKLFGNAKIKWGPRMRKSDKPDTKRNRIPNVCRCCPRGWDNPSTQSKWTKKSTKSKEEVICNTNSLKT